MSSSARPRGRPPLEAGSRSIEIGFSLPARDAHALTSLALVERVSQQDICRRAVVKYLREHTRSQSRLQRRVVLSRRLGL